MYNESNILPNFLNLFHDGRQLDTQETVESAMILAGDTITCREIDQIDITEDEEVGLERGFSGSALTGRICEPSRVESISTLTA